MRIPATEKERKALKVADLRAVLEEAGLDASGTKPALLERLEAHVSAGASTGALVEGPDRPRQGNRHQ